MCSLPAPPFCLIYSAHPQAGWLGGGTGQRGVFCLWSGSRSQPCFLQHPGAQQCSRFVKLATPVFPAVFHGWTCRSSPYSLLPATQKLQPLGHREQLEKRLAGIQANLCPLHQGTGPRALTDSHSQCQKGPGSPLESPKPLRAGGGRESPSGCCL